MLIGKKVQQHGLVAKPELNNTMGTMMGYGYGVRTRVEGVAALCRSQVPICFTKRPSKDTPEKM